MANNFDIRLGLDGRKYQDSMKEIQDELRHLEKMVDLGDKAIKQQGETLDTVGDKFKSQVKLYKNMEQACDSYSKGIKDANTKIDELTNALEEQKKELNETKKEYSKMCEELGENSKEAKALAREIKQQEKSIKGTENAIAKYTKQSNQMNRELQETKAKMNNLQGELSETGNKFDNLGGDVQDTIKDLKDYEKIIENINNKEIEPKINLEDTTKNIDKKIGINQINEGMSALDDMVGDFSRDFIKTSFDTVNTFDAVMSKVSAISGATGEDLDKLREKAKHLGATTKFSATEAAEGMQYMAMAGYSQKEILESIEPVMKLAIADGLDLATTSDIVTDSMTGFNLKAKDTQKFVDILAKTSTKSNTNVSLLGETFKYVAPVCGTLGINVQDAAVAIGLMANSGIKGSQAGTALRGGLSNLIKPSSEVKKAMEKYNVEIQKNKDGSVDLQKTMEHLRDKLGGLSEAEKGAALSAIFGKEGMSGWAAVINASDKDFKTLIDNIKNSNGATNEMANTMSANGKGAVDNFKSAMEGLYITIGEKLLPIITPVIQKVTEMISSIIAWCEENPKLAQTLGIVIGVLGAVLGIINTLLPIFIMFGVLGAGVSLAVIGIVVAITAVITAIILLWQNWDAVCQWCSQAWNNLCTWISEKWNGFTTWISESLSSIANWFSEKFNQAKIWATEKLQALLQWICSLPGKVWQGIVSIGQFFGNCFNNARTFAIQKLQALLNWVKGLPGRIWTGICNIAEKFGTAFNNARTKAVEKLKNIITEVGKIPGKIWDAIKSIPSKFAQAFSNAKQAALDAIRGLGGGLVGKIIDKVTGRSLNLDINTNENVARRVRTIGNTPLNNNLVATLSTLDTPTIANTTRDRINTVDFSNDFYNPISQASLTIAGQAVLGGIKEVKTDSTNSKLDMLIDLLLNMMSNGLDTNVNFNDKVVVRNETDIDLIIKKIDETKKMKDRRNGLTKITR